MDLFVLLIVALCIVALAVFFYFVPFLLWISALVSGVHISLVQLFLMRIRKVPPQIIVRAMIEAHKAGLKSITRDELEAHYLAGGRVERVVHALVSAAKANIDLGFQMATAIDLAGRDVFEAVQMSVNPKVIDTPPVVAVAKDGIQLIAKARVTVRANIRQLVGGAGEDTVLARVGEGIVSSIGSSESHKSVLENPDSISKLVLKKGLDSGTAFEILSIDIADIDIGKNIGAGLQIDQAQTDKNIAQAKAEDRSRTGNESQSAGGPCQSHRSRGGSAPGYGGGIQNGKSRYYGLLSNEKYRSRYFDARCHRKAFGRSVQIIMNAGSTRDENCFHRASAFFHTRPKSRAIRHENQKVHVFECFLYT